MQKLLLGFTLAAAIYAQGTKPDVKMPANRADRGAFADKFKQEGLVLVEASERLSMAGIQAIQKVGAADADRVKIEALSTVAVQMNNTVEKLLNCQDQKKWWYRFTRAIGLRSIDRHIRTACAVRIMNGEEYGAQLTAARQIVDQKSPLIDMDAKDGVVLHLPDGMEILLKRSSAPVKSGAGSGAVPEVR